MAVEGLSLSFKLPGVPGDPAFKGKLSNDGKTISGDFTDPRNNCASSSANDFGLGAEAYFEVVLKTVRQIQ